MSYNPRVKPDSSKNFFYQNKTIPYRRVHYANVAQEALITRKFGGKNPFWARGLDKVGKYNQKWNKFTRNKPWLKKRYIPFYPWYAKYGNDFQKGDKSPSRRNNSRNKLQYRCRCGFDSHGSNKYNRSKRYNRWAYKGHKNMYKRKQSKYRRY